MISRFSKTFSMMIGLLLVVAVPTQAGPIKFVDVINVMGDLQRGGQLQQLRLRTAPQDPTTRSIATNVTSAMGADPITGTTTATTTAPGVPSVLSGIEVTAQQPQTDVQVFQQDTVDGTICDCGEIPPVGGGGIPIWPFFALIPLVCLTGVCSHHSSPTPTPTPPGPNVPVPSLFCVNCSPTVTPTPTPTPTGPTPEVSVFCVNCSPTPPPVPEPTSLLLLGSGIVTVTAAARRRYMKNRASKDDTSETEGQ